MGVSVSASALTEQEEFVIEMFGQACRYAANDAMTARQNGTSLKTATNMYIKKSNDLLKITPDDNDQSSYYKSQLKIATESIVDETFKQAWQYKVAKTQAEKKKVITDFMQKREEECRTIVFNSLDEFR